MPHSSRFHRVARAVAGASAFAIVVAAAVTLPASPASPAGAAPAQRLEQPGFAAGNARFVDAIVRGLVGRPSNAGDQAEWLPPLAAGDPRAEVARQIARSRQGSRIVVDDQYGQILGRVPEDTGVDYWANRLAQGEPTATLASQLYASTEFFTRAAATIATYVNAVYRNLLERSPTPPGGPTGSSGWTRGLLGP
jgi:hypothetical protein